MIIITSYRDKNYWGCLAPQIKSWGCSSTPSTPTSAAYELSLNSISTIVLIVGIDMKKYGVPLPHASTNTSQYTLPGKTNQNGYTNNVLSYNAVKILTVGLVAACLPAYLPAIGPTSTRVWLQIFHTIKIILLFRLRLIHCAMDFLKFHPSLSLLILRISAS